VTTPYDQLQQVADILGKDRATEIIGQFIPAAMEPIIANVPDDQRQALLVTMAEAGDIYIPPLPTAEKPVAALPDAFPGIPTHISVADTVTQASKALSLPLSEIAKRIAAKPCVEDKLHGIIIHFAKFPDGVPTRLLGECGGASGIVLDFDGHNGKDKVTRTELEARVAAKGLAALFWDSFSATDKDTTFRCVLPSEELIPTNLYKSAARHVCKHVLGITAPDILPASQGYFCQSKPGNSPNVKHYDGAAIDTTYENYELTPETMGAEPGAIGTDEEMTAEQLSEVKVVLAALHKAGHHLSNQSGVWWKVGAFLSGYGALGEEMFLEFSDGDSKFSKRDCLKLLKAKRKEPVKAPGYLFDLAAKHGIANPATGVRQTPEEVFATDFEPPMVGTVGLDPKIAADMNRCVCMHDTLLKLGYGYPNLNGEWIKTDGKVATQQQGGLWSINGHPGINPALATLQVVFRGDVALAEETWRDWSKDTKQMAYFAGAVGGQGGYGAQAMAAFMMKEEATTGFRFIPFGELVSAIIQPRWVVKHWFERNTVTCIAGQPKHGKSFNAFDIGLHVAAGIPWCGMRVEQGPVFVVAGEGQGGTSRRVKGWLLKHPEVTGDIPFYVSNRAITLDAAGAKKVKEIIEGMCAEHNVLPAMILVDTLARSFPGDENKTEDMNTFIAALDQHLKGLDVALIVVHHSTKSGSDVLRGNSALRGALDGLIEVVKADAPNPAGGILIEVKPHWLKDGQTPAPLFFDCEVVSVGFDQDFEEITTLVPMLIANPNQAEAGLTEPQRRALEILRGMQGEDAGVGVPLRDWRAACVEAGIVNGTTAKAIENRMANIVTPLSNANAVFKPGGNDGKYRAVVFATFDDPST